MNIHDVAGQSTRCHRCGVQLIEVYQSTRSTMWDIDFRTAVAQAEVEDREIRGVLCRMHFALDSGGALPIATTRPELLAACVAVVVHPDEARYLRLVGGDTITPLLCSIHPARG